MVIVVQRGRRVYVCWSPNLLGINGDKYALHTEAQKQDRLQFSKVSLKRNEVDSRERVEP